MLVYPSGVDVSSSTLRFLAEHLRGHRHAINSRWRRLSAGRQALLALVHLRMGHTYSQLAAGFGVGTTTAYRYVTEAVDLLAALAPTLADAVRTASTKAFVLLDGTLLPIEQGRNPDLGISVAGLHIQTVEEFVTFGERIDAGVVEQDTDHAAWCSRPSLCRKALARDRARSETVTPVVCLTSSRACCTRCSFSSSVSSRATSSASRSFMVVPRSLAKTIRRSRTSLVVLILVPFSPIQPLYRQ